MFERFWVVLQPFTFIRVFADAACWLSQTLTASGLSDFLEHSLWKAVANSSRIRFDCPRAVWLESSALQECFKLCNLLPTYVHLIVSIKRELTTDLSFLFFLLESSLSRMKKSGQTRHELLGSDFCVIIAAVWYVMHLVVSRHVSDAAQLLRSHLNNLPPAVEFQPLPCSRLSKS